VETYNVKGHVKILKTVETRYTLRLNTMSMKGLDFGLFKNTFT